MNKYLCDDVIGIVNDYTEYTDIHDKVVNELNEEINNFRVSDINKYIPENLPNLRYKFGEYCLIRKRNHKHSGHAMVNRYKYFKYLVDNGNITSEQFQRAFFNI